MLAICGELVNSGHIFSSVDEETFHLFLPPLSSRKSNAIREYILNYEIERGCPFYEIKNEFDKG